MVAEVVHSVAGGYGVLQLQRRLAVVSVEGQCEGERGGGGKGKGDR